MVLKNIIFDVSGTIWDDREQVFIANYNVLLKNGYKNIPGTDLPLSIEWLCNNGKGSCVEMFRTFGMQGEDKELEDLYKAELKMSSVENPPIIYEGIEKLLFELYFKEINMHVISAHPQEHLDRDFSLFNINNYFYTSLGGIHQKTSAITELIDNYGYKQENSVYIGDTKSDMIAANQASVIPLAVSYGYQKKEQIQEGKPDKILDSVNSLSRYLLLNISR